ncbi:hypothetical protein ACHAXT_004403 [Thalassiosira profunda]
MPSSQSIPSFLAGAACSAALLYISQRARQQRRRPQQPFATSPNADDAEELLDSTDLDQRMLRKAEGALVKRTSRLIIVVERCTNDHNYSAILRTAEALGVQHVHIIAPQCIQSTLTATDGDDGVDLRRSAGAVVKGATDAEKKDRAMHHLYARKATEWLTVTDFDDTASCIESLRKDGYKIWATDLGQTAVCLTADALGRASDGAEIVPEKIALVFGTEAVGCSTEMLNAADLRVYLPLRGFADSLNLSVATALCVHQVFTLDPSLIGAMSEEERHELRSKWYAKLASQRLLSSRDKKRKAKLETELKALEKMEEKRAAGEKLHPEQLDKLAKREAKQAELDAMGNKLAADSQLAVKDLVANPPRPISDMRRADEHRICFVGRNTKASHSDAWADMPATANGRSTADSTASFFRQRVAQNQKNDC